MEIKQINWLEGFHETCQDIMEDAVLLEALAAYASTRGGRSAAFPQTLTRLTDYLSQHTRDLHSLEKRLGLEGQKKASF